MEAWRITDQITVSPKRPFWNRLTAEIGTNATERDVRNWPIFVDDGTRQLQDFIFNTMPGTSGNGFEGTINGGQQYSHEILIDGISIGRMDLNGGQQFRITPPWMLSNSSNCRLELCRRSTAIPRPRLPTLL